ncbi:MAG: hypothetical protein ACMUEM_05115 [Flavobacteriales bacterium AspAUS03]
MDTQTIKAIQTLIENTLSQNRQIKRFTFFWFSTENLYSTLRRSYYPYSIQPKQTLSV